MDEACAERVHALVRQRVLGLFERRRCATGCRGRRCTGTGLSRSNTDLLNCGLAQVSSGLGCGSDTTAAHASAPLLRGAGS